MPISDHQRRIRKQAVEDHFRIENTHDLDATMGTFGETSSFLANGQLHEGREAVRAFYGEFFRGFPDLLFVIKSLHIADEAIPVEMVLAGTHTGTWNGIAPTGRRFEIPVCAVFTFDANDRIVGERGYFDTALMFRQLGVAPHAA